MGYKMGKISFSSMDSLLGADGVQETKMINLESLVAFKDHPFKVIYDDAMKDLVTSIEEQGVITPILVREASSDQFEIISGHRRVHAAKQAGLTEIPAIVREMSDDDAIITMVDANMQREEILPSERAYSLKMKFEAMKRQGKRSDLTSDQNDPKLTAEELGESAGMSSAQVKRYIKMTDLVPELMNCLDEKTINANVAFELAFMDEESQKAVFDYLEQGYKLSGKQAKDLRAYNKDGTVIHNGDVKILLSKEDVRKPKRKFNLSSKKIDQYFPAEVSEEKIEEIIIGLLEKWKEGYNITNIGE